MRLVNVSQVEQCFAGHRLWEPGEERDLPDDLAVELLKNVNIQVVEDKTKKQEKEK